ncbi:DNA-processing protein DprA [Tessaracoccus caeni]|uniref:DNA-processing protein DprA n=1 Tax=Tessaracoccus caeni TaxID=3031239 RepID=UPI0023DC539E|nr:DNA-processing protein DprA [Tessaracoccus caeni]MDF1489813.1 DNA-processing protein DprA [Tessaracoccus caeni]
MATPALAEVVEQYGAEAVWGAVMGDGPDTRWGRKAAAVDLDGLEAATRACGARFLVPGDEDWPAHVAGLAAVEVNDQGGAPFGLWVRGQMPAFDGAVAMVGSRAASSYGTHITTELAADLAGHGRCVVSGLAYGIDAAAHRGALGVDGVTVACLAGGVDVPYPAMHTRLAEAVLRRGALISEQPPGNRAMKHAFLARNRLIAALAGGVILVEAALRSGARNTAAWASALGRPLMAVPGPVTSSLSATPHRLIREAQAVLVTSSRDVEELLSPLGSVPDAPDRAPDRPLDVLPIALRELREAVATGEEVGAAELSSRTGQPMMACLAGADELAEQGWLVAGDNGGWRLPSRPR